MFQRNAYSSYLPFGSDARQVDPTPTEIAERCAQVREHWTMDDYRERAGALRVVPWRCPVVNVSDDGEYA